MNTPPGSGKMEAGEERWPSAGLGVNGDGRELSKDRVIQKVMAVKNNYIVIRMSVAN